MAASYLLNPRRVSGPTRTRAPSARAFHRRLPDYVPTPLLDAPALAERLRVGRLWVKDETTRLGLPAFKMLGASWAVYRALGARLGTEPAPWSTLEELSGLLAPLRPFRLAAATDGNHGRAVARMARLLDADCLIFVPAGTAAARIAAIQGEGARVEVVEGTYDDAVARSAEEEGERSFVISDTSWPGYEDVPRWVIEGYATILEEVDDDLARRGERPVEVVSVPIGVGALGAAVVDHYRAADRADHPWLLGVEPSSAACVAAAVVAGEPVLVPGPHPSMMAGLNCGLASVVALPSVSAGIDAFVAIDDERTAEAMRVLADVGVEAGETGAAALAGVAEVLAAGSAWTSPLGPDATVLVLCTEGPTDPANYQVVTGNRPAAIGV